MKFKLMFVLILGCMLLSGVFGAPTGTTRPLPKQQQLRAHSQEFEPPQIIEVTDGVYAATGYALSNMMMIKGNDGIVIVDTTESSEVALAIMKEFRKITDLPLKGIILTHFHKDHVAGANALIEDSGQDVKVYAHCTIEDEFKKLNFITKGGWRRTRRQIGNSLSDDERINAGIGPKLEIKDAYDLDPVPTVTFCDNLDFSLAGLNFELFHTPGETNDQITAWLPDKRVVFPGDNIYKSFPNIYTIRGAPPRDARKWYQSLDLVRDLQPEHMVPSHTRPMSGAEAIEDTLTIYRDAIQFVHDQTVRHMNNGTALDVMTQQIQLPSDKMRNHEFLQEYYGSVEWSVRGVYEFYMGWFDEDPVHLLPLSNKQETELLVRMLSGHEDGREEEMFDLMLRDAEASLETFNDLSMSDGDVINELRWAMKLGSSVAKVCNKDSPSPACDRAELAQVNAMKHLAVMTQNSNARNYYLSYAEELEDGVAELTTAKEKYIKYADLDNLVAQFSSMVNGDNCASLTRNIKGRFIFDKGTDDPRSYYLEFRNCVVISKRIDEHEASSPTDDVDFVLDTTSQLWRKALTSRLHHVRLIFHLTKGRLAYIQFMRYLTG